MDIIWFGHSCFKLNSAQASVLTDPVGLPDDAQVGQPDIVTLSDRELRQQSIPMAGARLVDGPGEYEIKGVPITGIALPRPEPVAAGMARYAFVYNVVLDGITTCHLGRLRDLPAGVRIQELGSPDVVLIPLGEPFGLATARATQLASQLEAKLLVPMLFGGPNDHAALESFCKELGADPTVVESRISVSASGLSASQTRVAILAPQSAA
ncbi:MAG TPA: MBL fold metallo-hydrolase [Chloroflexota bacterium]|nr:MBL fold metallo-hydrolase [Chloroflexota bacterium]